MVVVAAFVGVHGSGKSTTARILSNILAERHRVKVGVAYVGAPGWALKLPVGPVRQAAFLAGYLDSYVKALQAGDPVVADSHPIMVPAYTAALLGDWALAYAQLRVVTSLPRVEVLVYLRPEPVHNVAGIAERAGERGIPGAGGDVLLNAAVALDAIVEEYWGFVAHNLVKINPYSDPRSNAEKIAARILNTLARVAGG